MCHLSVYLCIQHDIVCSLSGFSLRYPNGSSALSRFLITFSEHKMRYRRTIIIFVMCCLLILAFCVPHFMFHRHVVFSFGFLCIFSVDSIFFYSILFVVSSFLLFSPSSQSSCSALAPPPFLSVILPCPPPRGVKRRGGCMGTPWHPLDIHSLGGIQSVSLN